MTLQNMTVRAKLVGAFGGLALMVLVVAGLSLKALEDANQSFDGYVHGLSARARLAVAVRTAVDRRAIAARNLVLVSKPAEIAVEKAEVLQAHEDVKTRLAKLQQMAQASDVTQKARDLIGVMVQVEEKYSPVALAIVDLALKRETDEAVRRMNDECRPLLAALIKAEQDYSAYAELRSDQAIEAAAAHFATQRNALLLACVVAFLAAAAAGTLIVRSLSRALGAEPAELSAAAGKVAAGDLGTIAGASQAPAGSVLASLGAMQASLAGIVRQVRESSDSIATGSTEIAVGNANLSQRTEEQASALQQTAATMEELGTTVRHNAENAQQANQLAASASGMAVKGGGVVGEVVETMKNIDASSKKVADIIGVIDSIAFQTNILALNAAVEAARAGEQGRGFAVVAAEVRSLAQRSAQAAKEIKTLISVSVQQVEQGTVLVGRAGETMTEVVAAIERVSAIVGEISAASGEQSEGVAQIGQAVSQMDQATQQNAALVEESAAAAESLRVQAGQLVQAVSAFALDKSQSTVAVSKPAPVERRGPGRATNVTRPAFGAQRVATKVAPRPTARTGTDDWSEF